MGGIKIDVSKYEDELERKRGSSRPTASKAASATSVAASTASRRTDTLVKHKDEATLAIQSRTTLNDKNIHQAAQDFFYHGLEKKNAVEREVGHRSRWDTSEVTNMRKLFNAPKTSG